MAVKAPLALGIVRKLVRPTIARGEIVVVATLASSCIGIGTASSGSVCSSTIPCFVCPFGGRCGGMEDFKGVVQFVLLAK